MNFRSLLLALCALPALASAADKLPGLYFSYGDWELVCDNTGTCRAAGYQSDEESHAISVLLTRKAGPGQNVSAELQLGQLDETTPKRPTVRALSLRIDGAKTGSVNAGDGPAPLAPPVVSALLSALHRNASIEWRAANQRWLLSGKGAAAVLLKMDEFQGRVGTRGALLKPGSEPETAVLKPTPAPQVRPVAWAATLPKDSERFAGSQGTALRQALRATLTNEDDLCPDVLDPSAGDAEPISVWRLDSRRLLVSTRCWLGAYNIGYGFWVIDNSNAFNPVLVTTSGAEVDGTSITSDIKGRGVGDCRSSDTWTWDGNVFIHSASSVTGLCKMVAAGGTWELPRIVTDMRVAR